MISRRELLRRLGLSSIAIAAAPVAAKLNEMPLPKQATVKTPKKVSQLKNAQISMNGHVVGNVVSFASETQRPTIEVTNLSSVARTYIPEPSRLTVTIIDADHVHIQDALMGSSLVETVMRVDGYEYTFNAYIGSCSVNASVDSLISHEVTMEIVGMVGFS